MANKVTYIRYNQPYVSHYNPNMKFQIVVRSYNASDKVGTKKLECCINGAIDGVDIACDLLSSGTDVSQTNHCILRDVGGRTASGYNYHMVESLANACDSLGIADKSITFKDSEGKDRLLEQKFSKLPNSRNVTTKTYVDGELFDERQTSLTYTQTTYGDDNAITNYIAYLPNSQVFSTNISDSVIKAIQTNNFSGLVKLPSTVTSTYKAKTNITYYRRVTFAQTDKETTYTVQWGTANNSYTNTYISRRMVFNGENYETASNLLSTASNYDLADLAKYLDSLTGTPTIKKTPVYGVMTSQQLAILTSDNCLRTYGSNRTLVSEESNIIGLLGYYSTPGNLYQILYRSPINQMGLSTDGANSRLDCYRSELPVFMNATTKTLTSISAEGFDVPVLCVATGHVNKTYLVVAMNGDIYGGSRYTPLTKIGTLPGAYKAIIDTDENGNEVYFLLDTDNIMYRISSATLEYTILGSRSGVKDVVYNSSTYFGGPGITIHTVDNQIYVLDTDTLNIKSLQSGTCGLLLHDINPTVDKDFGYIDTSGVIHTYGTYGNNPTWKDKYYTPIATPNTDMMPLVPGNITGQYNSLNGLLYYYKIEFSFKSSQLVYTVYYGTTEAYGSVYTIVTMNVDPTLYNTITRLAVTDATAKLDKLKNHLNAINGPITVPANKVTRYTTKSNKVITIETSYEMVSTTDIETVIRYNTVYIGSTMVESYKSGTHTIIPDNYKTYQTDLAKYASDHVNEIVRDKLGLWNVTVPEDSIIMWTNKGDIQYYFKVVYSQGQTSDTNNSINYQISYAKVGQTPTVAVTNFHLFTNDNYFFALDSLSNKVTTDIAELQASLDIPNITPKTTTMELYQVNGFEYELSVQHVKSTAINKIVTTAFIDSIQYGETTETEFFEQSAADANLTTLTSTLLYEMKQKCANSPEDLSEIITVGNCQFSIETRYTKPQGVRMGYVRVYLDNELYTTETVGISASTIIDDLFTIKAIGQDKFRKLRDIIMGFPSDGSDTFTVSNMSFFLAFRMVKFANSMELQFRSTCDGIGYHEDIVLLSAQTIQDNIASIETLKSSEIQSMKQHLTGNLPLESGDIVSIGGLRFYVGCTYTKEAGKSTVLISGLRDGNVYSTSQLDSSIMTIDVDRADMIMIANNIKSAIRDEIESHPLINTTRNYVVNGFSYLIKTSYYKQDGDNNVSITVDLDGLTYYNSNNAIDLNGLGQSLDRFKDLAALTEQGLVNILDGSPSNNEYEDYVIDGFIYHITSTYSKRLNSHDVSITISIDGKAQASFTETIEAGTVAADITRIKSNVSSQIGVFKSDLSGIPTISDIFTQNGFNYNIRALFDKNIATGNIAISTTVDNKPYGNATVVPFIKEDISRYRAEGQRLIDQVKASLTTPVLNSFIYSAYDFFFDVSFEMTKMQDTDTVTVSTFLDGNDLGEPVILSFDIYNPDTILRDMEPVIENLRRRLAQVPTNASVNVTMNGFRFNIAHKYLKQKESDDVKIQILLDGSLYKELTETYTIDDTDRLAVLVSIEEENLRNKLRQCPANYDETWTFGTFSFYVEAIFTKQENSNVIRSVLKIDGTQYEETYVEQFDIGGIENIGSFLFGHIQAVKTRYESLIPADIHTTYSRNGYNFDVDITMSKQAGTDVVDITYTINSRDKNTESVTVTLQESMSEVINNQG